MKLALAALMFGALLLAAGGGYAVGNAQGWGVGYATGYEAWHEPKPTATPTREEQRMQCYRATNPDALGVCLKENGGLPTSR
jgi:hypothetical protein